MRNDAGSERGNGSGGRRGGGDTGTAVVVGAGVGGLATAIGLRRAGWTVTVLERRSRLERYGTAFGLHPTAQAALDRLGLGEALRARAVRYRSARIRRPDGKVLAALPLERVERKAGRPELLISRPYLIDALLAEPDRLGGTRIVYGQRLTDPDGLGADLVVGADGINSAVRTARFGTASGPRPVGAVAWIGIAGYETGVYGETWGAGRFFGMTPSNPGAPTGTPPSPRPPRRRPPPPTRPPHSCVPRSPAGTNPSRRSLPTPTRRPGSGTSCATFIRRCPRSSTAWAAPRWWATRPTP